ncbi:hypothetical protein DVP71_17950 [Yersinia enterocolitica]|nr:hypothetical protein [Yersinia enterocolitica]
MDDKSIEKTLIGKKFISKRDIKFIYKQATGNNSSLEVTIINLKRIFLFMVSLHLLLFFIGVTIFITSDFSFFRSYLVTAVFGIIMMHFVAPITLGAKLLFVSLKE